MTDTWQLHDYYMTVELLLLDYYMTSTWQLHDIYMNSRWQQHDCYITATWLLHDCYMTETWLTTNFINTSWLNADYLIATWFIYDCFRTVASWLTNSGSKPGVQPGGRSAPWQDLKSLLQTGQAALVMALIILLVALPVITLAIVKR